MKAKAKKIAVGIAGGVVLAVGIAMLVLPGPAFIIIPAGLAILATEFEFAQRWKESVEKRFHKWRDEHRARKAQKKAQAHAT